MLLRNFDFATKYFNLESKIELEDTSNPRINGWYKIINGLLSALLVEDNNIYFLYGDKRIRIMESCKVLLKNINTENELSLVRGSDVLIRFLYHLPDPKLNVSPFEYINESDFNWGEFLAEIINDRERQRNFVMNLMEGH